MIKSGIGRFLITAAVIVCATVCLASGATEPNWSYTYKDYYESSDKVENDSFYHSIIWPQGAFPPSEPYLFHKDTGELGFGGLNGQVNAQLVYRFPLEQEQDIRTISGRLKIEVLFPYDNSGSKQELQYSLSSDGINWSAAKKLEEGTNYISIKSVRGICYITFSGIGVLIDYIEVVLNSDPADYFVPSTQCPTIQAAIDLAQDSDINEVSIEVAPGTYKGAGNCEIDFKGKAITVYSKKGPEQTIIDCESKYRGFYFHQGEVSSSVLRGFTIKNGAKSGTVIPDEDDYWIQNSSHPIGGGIYCEFSSPSIINCIIQNCSTILGGGIGIVGASPMIADCVIQNCYVGNPSSHRLGGYGAGIALIRDSDAVIVNTIIKNNKGYNTSLGAGVYCSQSTALLANCEIRSNSAGTSGSVTGGGVYAAGLLTDIELRNCIIADNIAQSGAGIFTDSIEDTTDMESDEICNVLVTNCTIANNDIPSPQSTIGGGIHSLCCNIVVQNSIVWGNDSQNIYIDDAVYEYPVRYSNVQGDYEGQYNISIDPCFASPSTGDYHLKSRYGRYNPVQKTWILDTAHSACIDAGDPQNAIGPEPFPHGKRINMGAYGGTEQASMNFTQYIFHVAKIGSNSNTGLSREKAFLTIQRAVNEAVDGDVIMIWPGIYEEEVSFAGKAITIQSADDAAEVRAKGGYAFSFNQGLYRDSILRNLIITNCGLGAIYCEGASPTLMNLTIAYNNYGIYSGESGSSAIVKHCIFYNNTYGDFDIHDPLIKYNITYCRLGTGQFNYVSDKTTNFTDNPRFANSNKENGDYHLQSFYGRYSATNGWVGPDSYHSKCIDAGDIEISFGREPWPNNGIINIGAYGGTPYASRSSISTSPIYGDAAP
ncbi:MAG: hypothetical protein JW787_09420 [Sedimentisphaerales bacterium]|nr:hypothetical protein [Sedimentisphaerales bacterium]